MFATTTAPIAPVKAPIITAITLRLTCGKEQIGTLAFQPNNKLVPGHAKKCRRFMMRKMFMKRSEADAVILTVMSRYTKGDHVFGCFDLKGKRFGFMDPEFDEVFKDEQKKK